MKILTLCFMLCLLSGCGMLQELQQRVTQAESDLNSSKDDLEDAREEFEDAQAAVDAKQKEIENAIAMGDLETAKLLAAEISAARDKADEANERVKDAEENFDQFGDALTAAKNQVKDAEGPWDYIYGIIALVGGFFGIGGITKGVTERQKRKIAEENQLNPRNTS